MGSKKNTSAPVHTSGNRKDGYKNTQNGKQIGGTFDKKDSAKKAGRQKAIDSKTEHVIHKDDGQIQEKNSYGNDPEKSKG